MELPHKFESLNINVTGFGKFAGVEFNPTTFIVESLPEYLKEHSLGPNVTLGRREILKVAAKSVTEYLNELYPQMYKEQRQNPKTRQISIHFGVFEGINCFHIEKTGWNWADFRVPDEDGWQPQGQKINPLNPCEKIKNKMVKCKRLANDLAQEFPDKAFLSNDPGRFVCNWTYFSSLERSSIFHIPCLFVHVPGFDEINEADQMQMVWCLFRLLYLEFCSN